MLEMRSYMHDGMKRMTSRRVTLAAAVFLMGASAASAAPYLVVDAESGQALIENQATQPWYPASLTKLMTTYVALQAVRDNRLTMDTPLTVSMRAARMPASKMGFAPGTEVTLDNALKMLMVKSPNDIAVVVAEGIDGSVEGFADEMNAVARKLGMRESHFVNPNGLHDPAHVSSARDMAILARALLRDFPDHADLFDIGAIQLGDIIIPNHNGLLGHYPGADGMKTGFTCPAGFNVVASATHNGRKLITVVLGSPSARTRTLEAAQLFERGFSQGSNGVSLDSLPLAANPQPPDMRGEICSRRNHAAVMAAEEEMFSSPQATAPSAPTGRSGAPPGGPAPAPPSSPVALLSTERVHFDPVPVFVGAKDGWTGPVLAAKPTEAAPVTPPDATAYSSDKPATGDVSAAMPAPLALQGAVKSPVPAKPVKPPRGVRPPPKVAKAAIKPPVKPKPHKASGT